MLKPYLTKILETARLGDAREESYYSILEALLDDFARLTCRREVHVTILPKKTDAGNPDFRVWDGKRKVVGYIEAKIPHKNLDETEKTGQLQRYMTTFPNFILTNFFEFRLYRNGQCINKTKIADPLATSDLRGVPQVEHEENFMRLLEEFFSFCLPSITTTQSLALELAKRTRFLRDEVIAEEIIEEEKIGIRRLLGFYEAFQKYLIRGLTKEQFADLYSQTITYGLFASRMRCEGEFSRKTAVYDIPHTIGILREMFNFISLGDLPPQLEWIVDEISDVLANVDVKGIFSEYFRIKKGEDPVFPFYESFLAEYDPEEREKRGVYYTPGPVVSYIVRSLHLILKSSFGLNDGLAERNLTILDPAAGTLTFLAEAIKQATKEFTSKYGEGGRQNLIREHILRNFYAFELLIAPYAIGHLKISFLLEELGYSLQKDERIRFYLTNTLEMEDIEQTALPGMASLSEESHLAGIVKKKTPILIIMGNPPYSGHSSNIGQWISEEIREYYVVDGKSLSEKNPKWLQDDYVKFVRFAQWKIDNAGEGILGFITNHSYLDNPTFRGMRQSLMKSFNEIHVLDLHGNALKREKSPDGGKDENVFDIRQGVAIAFFVKKKGDDLSGKCRILHGEIWGLREKKNDFLQANDISTTRWEEIFPHSPSYFFVPREEKYIELYSKYWKITDIFITSRAGIVTARDDLTIQATPDAVWNVVQDFASSSEEEARIKYDLGKDARDWKVALAQQDLKKTGLRKELVVPILYRPFDTRYTYYTGHSRGFICMPRQEIMHHMMRENLGFLWTRPMSPKYDFSVFVANTIVDQCAIGNKTAGAGISYIGPLYLYGENKKPNLNPQLIAQLRKHYGRSMPQDPKSLFYYVYAVLHSNVYRIKYADFLRTDLPRVPFTTDYGLFDKMQELGERLANLHLMKSRELSDSIAKFEGEGDNIIENPSFDENRRRVYINKTQFFDGIRRDLWEYQIGGYQVLHKWLKDRKGRRLLLEDVKNYCKIATAIERTMEIQKEIDGFYSSVEKNIIEFSENNQNADLSGYTRQQ
jgi:hypothetical protein